MNRRQMEILLEMCNRPDSYLTASWFARKQGVSLRTVRNDMNAIRRELENSPCAEFQTSASRGSRIAVKDAAKLEELRNGLFSQLSEQALDDMDGRLQKLLILLLRQHRAVSYYDLETAVFVSRNTLLSDLKRAEGILKKYGVEILRDSNRLVTDGKEADKRRCILGENLASIKPDDPAQDARKGIRGILDETFSLFRHSVSEAERGDMTDWLYVSLRRMEENFFLAPDGLEIEEDLFSERKIAEAVYGRLRRKYGISPTDAELDYFALYIRSQRNFAPPAPIPAEIRELVTSFLEFARRHISIDLTFDSVFQTGLELHCIPMLVRIKYDMQMKSRIAEDVRKSFPFGYDMATYFASFLQEKYGREIQETEIALLAVHMQHALSNLQRRSGRKRVLVLSSQRRSGELLIRRTLESWFPDQIGELAFLPPVEMDESKLDRFDIFLTTEQNRFYEIGLAIYIHPIPSQQDYWNIQSALDGFENVNDLLRVFRPELFYVFKTAVSRDAALRTLCNKTRIFLNIPPFHSAVLEREAIGSTFFGGEIAAPHPVTALPYDTFITVGVLPRPVKWDSEGNQVRLVFLNSVNKNNSSSFHRIWHYLGRIFARRDFAERLLAEPSYERFLQLLKEAVKANFEDIL